MDHTVQLGSAVLLRPENPPIAYMEIQCRGCKAYRAQIAMSTVDEVFDLTTRKDGCAPRMLLIRKRVPNGPILSALDPDDLEILHFTGRVRDILGLRYRGIQ